MRRIERTFLEIYPVIKNKERKKEKKLRERKTLAYGGGNKKLKQVYNLTQLEV